MAIREGVNILKKTVLKILSLLAVAALAFTVVHFAVLGNNSPTDTAFTFAVEDGKAILTGSEESLSGAVVLPAEIAGYTVTGIGDDAFKDCSDVTAFFLPDTLRTIGSYAFENCSSLAQAILPEGLTSIGEGAFWKCSSLVSVTVPASVRSIGSCAFYKCDALESLVIPGVQTPVRGIFNVALDIGQTLSVTHRNGAKSAIDPVVTTVYCHKDSVAYFDALADSFSTLVLLEDCTLTSYTIRYTDTADADVAPSVTLDGQPQGIRVAAVATVVNEPELVYADPAIQTIELAADAAENVITFVYGVRTYTVTFDANGGEAKEALVYATTDTAALGDTTRAGYTFAGWKVSVASGDHYNWGDADTSYTAQDTVTDKFGDVTLIAVWEGNAITVTYDAQGGTPDAAQKVVTFGDTYGELAGASREGYTFAGWYSAANGGSRIESTTTVTNTQDHSIFARWTINHYNITVTTDGNGTAAADPAQDAAFGTTVTLTAEANPGYSFSAWESEDVTVAADGTFTVPDKAVTVHAVFAPNTYTLTFDTDGGDAKAPLTYTTTDSAVLGSAAKAGYTLTGWRVSAAAAEGDYNWGDTDTVYTAEDAVTGKYGDATLSAIWQGNAITVTYNAQGGTPDAESKSVTVGGVYGELTGASREGYTFGGWYSAADGGSRIEAATTVSQTADHEIFALWSINHYDVTVTNDGNGTAAADPAENVAYGTTVTLTAAPKSGYSFAAWDSEDVTVAADGTFSMPDKAVSVKATFEPAAYTITFDTDGGAEKQAVTYKTTDTATLGTTEKAGYTFLGWAVKTPAASGDYNWGDADTAYSAAQSVSGKYGDVTLKALWAANNIVVTYDAQGGSTFVPSKTVTVGGVYGTLANAAREGYTFAGWFTAAEGGTQISSDTPVTATADHPIFAHWTINSYDITVTTDGHGTASADPAANAAYGATVTLTAEPATGYAFSAWESSDVTVNANGAFTVPAKNVTVKAVFAPIAYTIAFDANTGENTMEPINAVYDAQVKLPANAFVKAGFEFLGWARTADAEAIEFADEADVQNLTATAGETVTLYALWKDIKVELVAQEGSTTVIDEERGFIYGLDFGLDEAVLDETFLDILGNGHLEYTYNEYEGVIGTGVVVNLINDNTGETAATYTIVIFGDVNGDGMLTTTDITAIRNINARISEFTADSANYFAADVTHDGMVNPTDVTEVRSVNARLSQKTIDQVGADEG